jgi:hypothetical protein
MKTTQENKTTSKKTLTHIFSIVPRVAIMCVHRSKTNIKAEFRVFACLNNDILDITWHVGVLLNANGKNGVVARGYEYDQEMHIVNNLEYELYGDNTRVLEVNKLYRAM